MGDPLLTFKTAPNQHRLSADSRSISLDASPLTLPAPLGEGRIGKPSRPSVGKKKSSTLAAAGGPSERDLFWDAYGQGTISPYLPSMLFFKGPLLFFKAFSDKTTQGQTKPEEIQR